jgi:ankyrin repeat protein
MYSALAQYLEGLSELPSFGDQTMHVGSRDGMQNTPLHYAVIQDRLEVVGWLLDAGADPNAEGEDRFTPLHEAVLHGRLNIIRLLLSRGADPKRKSGMGDAFQIAKVEESAETIKALNENGA